MTRARGSSIADERAIRERKMVRIQSLAVYVLAGISLVLAFVGLVMAFFTNELFGPVAAEFPSSIAKATPGDANLIVPDNYVVRIERLDSTVLRVAWNALAALKYLSMAGLFASAARVTGRLADESPFSDRNLGTMRLAQIWTIPLIVSILGAQFLDNAIAGSVGLQAAESSSTLILDEPMFIVIAVIGALGLMVRANKLQRQADETL